MFDMTTEFSNFIAGDIPIIVHNTLMDGLKKRGKVIVIAATNRPNSLDPALRRTGRFDRELEIPVPNKQGRKEILQIHTRHMPLEKDVDIDHLAEITYGFVGADLAGLAKEAAMHALRRVMPDLTALKEDEPIPDEIKKKLKVTKEDFDYAMRVVQPSGMREVMVEAPKTTWEDVGGLDEAKKTLIEAVDWPLNHHEAFERLGIRPPKGILLYGPPGCGKTHIVKALAHESGVNFISIKAGELMSKWVGESEKHVRDVFRRAKQVAPTIIFFDEIDALAPRRGLSLGSDVSEKVVSQMLTEMSGLEELKGVVVIAATNRPDIVDPALLRPGRFDKLIYIGPPDEKSRKQILEVHTKNMPLAKNVNLNEIAKKTDGYSGADLEAIVREAALNALREDINTKEVKKKHFDEALKKIRPSISANVRKKYEKIVEQIKKNEPDQSSRYIG
ncbi:MAG: AAA family ATPase [Candidatus Aenigmarchaeota archaeon]|nr:AAA family ATPase [Candidatus Aenigmarchaeota archaeon]